MNNIEKLDIITIDTNAKYLVVESLDVEEKTYLLLNKLDEEEDISEDYIIVEKIKNNKGYGIKKINDENELLFVRDLFLPLIQANYS